MDRRSFLKRSGAVAVLAAVAPRKLLDLPKPESVAVPAAPAIQKMTHTVIVHPNDLADVAQLQGLIEKHLALVLREEEEHHMLFGYGR